MSLKGDVTTFIQKWGPMLASRRAGEGLASDVQFSTKDLRLIHETCSI
jgi:hypothetical protein